MPFDIDSNAVHLDGLVFVGTRHSNPAPPASRVGRPRKWPMRRIVEAILYLLRGGLP